MTYVVYSLCQCSVEFFNTDNHSKKSQEHNDCRQQHKRCDKYHWTGHNEVDIGHQRQKNQTDKNIKINHNFLLFSKASHDVHLLENSKIIITKKRF